MKISTTHFRSRLQKGRLRGLSLIETAMVLAVISLLLVFFVNMTQTETERLRAKNTADKLVTISEAAKAYMTSNYAALLASAPAVGSGAQVVRIGRPSMSAAVPANSLQAKGFLPPSFIDANSFQQRTALLVRKVNARTLEAMLTTYGGLEIPDRMLGSMANLIGPAGGYVPSKYAVAADNGNIIGVGGGWRTPINQWGTAIERPLAGNLQMTMIFEDGELLKDYLYRNDVGVPEANRMNTNIDMNAKSLNNTNTITGIDKGGAVGKAVTIGTTSDTSSLDVTRDIFAGRDLKVARNAKVEGYVQGKSLRSDSYVDAKTFVEAGTYVRAQNNVMAGKNVIAGQDVKAGRDLEVGRNATIEGDLVAGRISIDAEVFGKDVETGKARNFGGTDNLTLGDLMPRMVAQYSYMVKPGNAVAKPTCRGGYGKARIMVYRQIDSSRSKPNIPLIVQMGSGNGVGPFVGDVEVNKNSSYVDIAQGIVAVDNGASWTVNWVGDPAASTASRQAIAQTFCYYGKA